MTTEFTGIEGVATVEGMISLVHSGACEVRVIGSSVGRAPVVTIALRFPMGSIRVAMDELTYLAFSKHWNVAIGEAQKAVQAVSADILRPEFGRRPQGEGEPA